MNRTTPFHKLLSMVLSVAMMMGMTPVTVFAEQDGPALGASGEITAFAPLPEDVRFQRGSVPTLPQTVEAIVNEATAAIPVVWATETDATQPGLHLFLAKTGDGYAVAEGVSAPTISFVRTSLGRMGGTGTAASPLQITTAAELREIAELVNAGQLETMVHGSNRKVYLRLMNDIDLSVYQSGEGWVPIGSDTQPFTGELDAGEHRITGLTIHRPTADFIGLFGYVDSGAVVENLGLVNVSINGQYNVGGVVGYVADATVTSCYVTGSMSGHSFVGGVAGDVGGTLTTCYSTATVTGNSFVGGVTGRAGGSVTNCYATGNVRGNIAGGVAGTVSGTVENCAALSASITASTGTGRITAMAGWSHTLTNNIAYSGMVGSSGNPDFNGADISAATIAADGTLGGLFGSAPWTTENGKLPGLFGQTVPMPGYINTGGTFFAGTGTSGDSYQIRTASELALVAELVNAGNTTYNASGVCYQLTANVDLSGYRSGGGWVPIGYNGNIPFLGNFDGTGHIITGLYINNNTYDSTGLFGFTKGTIQNLGVVNADITGAGITGGVAGVVYGTMRNCYFTGSVSGTDYVGGIAAYSNGTITNCYSAGAVSGRSFVGGVMGWMNLSGSMVTSCYSTANVTGTGNFVGGVVGAINGGTTVANCGALNPSVSGSGNNVGRVAGKNDGTATGNISFDGMDCTSNGSNFNDGTAISAATIAADGTLSGLFGSAPWETENGKLPGLGAAVEMPVHLLNSTTNPFAGGDGSSQTPYKIATAQQLATLAELVNGGNTTYSARGVCYQLTANIDLSGYRSGEGWVPIGADGGYKFFGNFDGDGHIITGLYINQPNSDYQGLFGIIEGNVGNLGIVAATITGKDIVGGVAGFATGTMRNCYITGSVCGNDVVGGVAGAVGYYSERGNLRNCYSTATVSGASTVGGVAGEVNGSVTGCYSTGTISGTGLNVGGIVGLIFIGRTVTNCAALNPSVSGSSDVGRVVGREPDTATGNYAFGGMTGGTWSHIGANDLDGANMTKQQAADPSVWTGTLAWDATVWAFAPGKLPTLKDIPGQDGEPGLYLTQLPSGTLNFITPNQTISASASVQTRTLEVTGWENWTHNIIDFTVTAAPANSGLAVSSTQNGKAALNIPANYSGAVTVTAANQNSGRSVFATVAVTATAPAAPTGVTAVAGDGLAVVSFVPPAYTGGLVITGYTVTASNGQMATGTASPITVPGLQNGTSYTFTVTATNVEGNSAASAPSNGVTPVVPAISVSGVILNKSTMTLVAGGTAETLSATVLPANASNPAVTWQSSDTSVAMVSGGVVTPVAAGNAVITVATVDGGKTATCAVVVLPAGTATVPVSGVSISPATISLKIGGSAQLIATASPHNATIRDVSWSSSNTDIVSVDGSGKVTAHGAGSATITATADGGKTATCAVTVTSSTGGGYTSGGSSSSRNNSRSTSPSVAVSTTLTVDAAGAKAALAAMKPVDTKARITGSGSIKVLAEAWKVFGKTPVMFDTIMDKAVQVRVTVGVPDNMTGEMQLAGVVKGNAVTKLQNSFAKRFGNKVQVIHFEQTGAWGQPVEIAAKVDLTGMDAENLAIYSYDKTANTYKRIEMPNDWIDKNGYLHFTTSLAGDIVISDGALVRK